MTAAPMTRGELARLSGVNSETIIYFERCGLLPRPDRTAGGHRRYSHEHLRILTLMAAAQGLGFTAKEVRTLVRLGAPGGAACDDVRQVASERLDQIRKKIADLQVLERLLAETVGRCSGGTTTDCAIVNLLVGCE